MMEEHKSTILILEDEAGVARLQQLHLERAGYSVKVVATAAEALACIEREKIELLVLDYRLPGQATGLDFYADLKARKLEVPVILVTGFSDDATVIKALRAGVRDFVTKSREYLAYLPEAVQRVLEQVRTASQLAELNQFNRAVLDSLSANIAVLDPAGKIIALNEAWRTFADANQLVGRPRLEDNYLDSVERAAKEGDRQAGRVLTGIKSVLDGVASSHIQEYCAESASGRRWFHLRVGRLSGERLGVVVAYSDITERKKAEESLQETNRTLEEAMRALNSKNDEVRAMSQQLWHAAKLASVGELAAGIAHELNNPLATVCLRVESALSRTPADDPRRRPLEIIQQESKRMGILVAGLLQFSRRGQEASTSVDVRDELLQALELIQHMMRKRRIQISQNLPQDLPTIFADRQKLRQLFLNLLTNAVDAMAQDGTLTLRAEPTTLEGGVPGIQIEISDTGAGIAPEHLARVMEPFFTTKEEGKGTGLGLAICRRVVQEHQGTLQIHSELGKGTTIRLKFPLQQGINVAPLRENATTERISSSSEDRRR